MSYTAYTRCMTTSKKTPSAGRRSSESAPDHLSDFKVIAFFAADHAAVADGKVYVNGGFFSRLNFPTYPAVVPSVTLVAVLEVPFHAYHEDHTVGMGLEDADGEALPLKVEGQFRVGADPTMKS